MNYTRRSGDQSREYYIKRLAQKEEELAAIDAQAGTALEKQTELKLERNAEMLLEEIEQLNSKLKELDKKNSVLNIRYKNIDKTLQKIDFSQARKKAESINKKLGNNSGAILIFLQKSTNQMGNYCLEEFLEVMNQDRKVGETIAGDFQRLEVDLDSGVSEFNQAEFSKRLASHFSSNLEEPLNKSLKIMCSSLRGGSIRFITIKNWDKVIDRISFLDWFMKDFWQNLILELNSVSQDYSRIRLIVALIAKGKDKVFTKKGAYPAYFCQSGRIDLNKIIELPLPNWKSKDLEDWLINFHALSNQESQKIAKDIIDEVGGTPFNICSILEKKILEDKLQNVK